MIRTSRIRKATTIAATFAIALGIGFFMQNGDANAARYGATAYVDPSQSILMMGYSGPNGQTAVLDYGTTLDRVHVVGLADDIEDAFSYVAPINVALRSCDMQAITVPDDTGSVILTVQSDCRADMPFTVNHNGLSFSAQADATGRAVLTIPALAQDATYFITFADGKSLVTSTYAPQASLYNRVVFQWEGAAGDYLRRSDMAGAAMRLDRLGVDVGDGARFAQIYSFPTDIELTTGLKGMDLVADITAKNCGTDLIAESLTVFPGTEGLMFEDIHVTLSDCQQVGTILQLKNALEDHTLALR